MFTFFKRNLFAVIAGFAIVSTFQIEAVAEVAHHVDANLTFLFIGIMLLLAKVSGLIEKWGQPSVLGELAIGIILGNLVYLHIPWFEGVHDNEILRFLGELGLVLLLFQAGLESNVQHLLKTGKNALVVATAGAVIPFAIGSFIIAPVLLPGLNTNTYLFIGACLASTSVAIAATLFRSYSVMKTPEAQVVMGSAVLDDVFGMVMLPVITAIVTAGAVSPAAVGLIVVKSLGFMVTSVLLGQKCAPFLGKFFAKINTGHGMKLTFALSLALILAYLAHLVGMSPIIGAFAAGLFLDPVHFNNFDSPKFYREMKELTSNETFNAKERDLIMKTAKNHAHHHIEDLVELLAHFTVPLFFILVGMNVNLAIFTEFQNIVIAVGILMIPIIARVIAAYMAGPNMDRGVIGMALVPNDEVGLVFATVARQLGAFDDRIFSIMVFVLIMTTLVGTFGLNFFLQRMTHKKHAEIGELAYAAVQK